MSDTLVILAPSRELAEEALRNFPVEVTIEAEYGSFVAEGTRYTAAHHQPAGSAYAGRHVDDKGQPSPCNNTNIPLLVGESAVLLSHLDLDSFGGALRTMPEFVDLFEDTPEKTDFWGLAEYIDVRGPHHLSNAGSPHTRAQLRAFWARGKSTPRFSRDRCTVVTQTVRDAGFTLRRIFADDPELLAAGEALQATEHALNARTFLGYNRGVIARQTDVATEFVNMLYEAPDESRIARAVVAWNQANGAITCSLAEPVDGVSCRDIVQKLWGPNAGGHAGIAGSPRGQTMTAEDFEAARLAMEDALDAR